MSFTGEMFDDDTSFGTFRALVRGSLDCNWICWQQAAYSTHNINNYSLWHLATLDFKGKLTFCGSRIKRGAIRDAAQLHVDDVLCGFFTAVRIALPLERMKRTLPVGCLGVLHCPQPKIVPTDAMLDAFR